MPLSFGAIVGRRPYNLVYIFCFSLCTHTMHRPLVRVMENIVVFFKRAEPAHSRIEIAVIVPLFSIRNTMYATRAFFRSGLQFASLKKIRQDKLAIVLRERSHIN